MRAVVRLVDRAERNAWWREAVYAVQDGAYWVWVVAVVAAVVVWLARGMPAPATAGAAAVVSVLGAGAGAWRAWRRYARNDPSERRAAAWGAVRRWLTLYATAAAVIPAVMAGAVLPVVLVVVALAELAIITIPLRARRRLLARIRIGAAAVAGDEQVTVGRALWSGRHLDRLYIGYPLDWAAHRPAKRDELVGSAMWTLCGPPPSTPAEAIARPDYLTTYNHIEHRLEVQRVPALPHRLAARDWGPRGAIVLGQTTVDLADIAVDGVPLATYVPDAHMLVTGATSFGKSSGARAWAVDGLTHGVWPGGLWDIDGKGSGSMVPLQNRRGVHAVAHVPDEWRAVIESVAAVVTTRYEEMLAWRAGRADRRPYHPRALLIIDEIQQVILACPDLLPVIDTLARQAMEAGIRVWILTQRPDAKDAVPGAIRDQLVDRACFGPLSSAGAKMTFDVAGDDWHRALGVAPIPGRALTWLGGAWRTVQAPWLPIPAEDPTVEPLYPPRASPGLDPAPRPAEDARRREPLPPKSGPILPAGREDAEESRQEHQEVPRQAPPTSGPTSLETVAEEILRDYGDPPSTAAPTSAAYDPTDPYANRRRRRRRD